MTSQTRGKVSQVHHQPHIPLDGGQAASRSWTSAGSEFAATQGRHLGQACESPVPHFIFCRLKSHKKRR